MLKIYVINIYVILNNIIFDYKNINYKMLLNSKSKIIKTNNIYVSILYDKNIVTTTIKLKNFDKNKKIAEVSPTPIINIMKNDIIIYKNENKYKYFMFRLNNKNNKLYDIYNIYKIIYSKQYSIIYNTKQKLELLILINLNNFKNIDKFKIFFNIYFKNYYVYIKINHFYNNIKINCLFNNKNDYIFI